MSSLPVVITDQDMRRIRGALSSSSASSFGHLAVELTRRLERAIHVRSDCIRPDIVTLNSCVSVEDPDTGHLNQYTLVLPGDNEVDPGSARLSVLAPLGWRILGRREGDMVQFRVPGSGSRRARIKRIDFQPEAERARGVIDSHDARQGAASHAEYPLELLCTHLYDPFQLTFARHAEQLLTQEDDVEVEATHQGLVLRGATEAALEHAVEQLRSYFGNQIHVGRASIRYHEGTRFEEPHMGLRVRCSPEHFEAIKADLIARGGSILVSQIDPVCGEIRATAPLAQLLGYRRSLAQLTSDTAHEVMWLSHYAPAEVAAGHTQHQA
jgi:regulator of nucleoside diphosphate kinase